jgi:uncharacterized protein (TIGR02757 family)
VSETLTPFLERLFDRYHQPGYLGSDPVEFVHRYQDPWDQEVVALLASVLAYGNVRQIRASVQGALDRMEAAAGAQGLARWIREAFGEGALPEVSRASRKVFQGWVHRFNRGEDLWILFRLLARSWERHGSLGAHFLSRSEPGGTIETPLNALISDWLAWEPEVRGEFPRSQSFFYLLTAPASGSCCKRWCMFLRWMGRKDAVDPGLWTRKGPWGADWGGRALEASQLVLPLDTHTGRISQYLGLTRRQSLNWKAALEVTERLRACDPYDPTKYDFALSRLGILDLCQKKYRVEVCSACELVQECRFARQKQRSQQRQRQRVSRRLPLP